MRKWMAVVFLLATACGGGAAAELSPRPVGVAVPVAVVPAPAATAAPATSVAVPTTVAVPTVTQPPPPGLRVGAEGPAVLALEQKLEALHYWVGQVDEAYDGDTRDAVLAFQKVYGMDRTGRATDDVVAAMAVKAPPPALVPNGGLSRIEVDLDRQVMFIYSGSVMSTILNVSTGSNERFCSEGWCRKAVTPTGSFTVYAKHFGWETGPLGSLYNAQYFNGGIAVHGSSSVPAYPASHGCVRLSMSAAEWFPDRVIVGTPVYVVSGDDPHPRPVAGATPVSTPTTIVADTVPQTTTTTLNLLQQLLAPPTTRRP